MTSRPSQAQQEMAERLLSYERGAGSDAGAGADAAGRVYQKLFSRLQPLLGSSTVQVLFGRSARRTTARFPFLDAVATEPAETLGEKLRECLQGQPVAEATEAAVALYAASLALLATFLGDELTMNVLRGAWPEIEEIAPKENAR